MGAACPGGDGSGFGEPAPGTLTCACGRGKRGSAAPGEGVGGQTVSGREGDEGEGTPLGLWQLQRGRGKKKPENRQEVREEAIRRVLEIIDVVKERFGKSYRGTCRALKIPRATFSRWRLRMKKGGALVNPPGPKKVEAFDAAVLQEDIRSLRHGTKRSLGTTQLYRRYQQSVSRRELGRMVEQVRHDLTMDHRRHLRRIEWVAIGVVWGMDSTEYEERSADGFKIYLHNTQDLGSRYKFPPLAGGYPEGEEIAGYLNDKFGQFGPPLVLKRDNEGIMNHMAVNSVLAEFLVLPLNSPEYYAPYNGAIEESQREMKRCLGEKLKLGVPCARDQIEPYAEAAAHDLNHRVRGCLGGTTSCQAYWQSARPTFAKRERREIYDCLMEWVGSILASLNKSDLMARQAAYRIAVESWLRSKGCIRVREGQKVSPCLPPVLVS